MTIHIVSFGYGHDQAPTADLTLDLRALLRNPFHDAQLKHRTGLDPEVYDHVKDTPGAERLAFNTVTTALGLAEDTRADVTIAWGCTGGRHRSVGLARLSHELLLGAGHKVTIEHRDVDKDLLPAGVHNRTEPEPETIRYTADVVAMTPGGDVLLIERGWAPHEGAWALPGGHVDRGETALQAAVRELEEETGVRVPASDLREIGVFDRPDRDPRGRYVTAAYLAIVPADTQITAGDDARTARWWPAANLPPLAFDHADILDLVATSTTEVANSNDMLMVDLSGKRGGPLSGDIG
ncbi:RNase adapter RapZ [Streptomyces sp. NPDC089922]|uniref:RapZ C-terminal domain-containing protein n=1 Tax=Streptomyces sp. NPDC089922 TaxID=3155189 RepID=UPI00341AD9AB